METTDFDSLAGLSGFFKTPMVPLTAGGKPVRQRHFKVMLLSRYDGYFLKVMDRNLKPLHLEPEQCTEGGAAFIRAYNNALAGSRMNNSNFRWGTDFDDDQVSASENPDLIPLLASVPEVVDEKGNKISFASAQYQPVVSLVRFSNKDKYDGFSIMASFATDDQDLSGDFITSEYGYAFTDRVICPIKSIGPNFRNFKDITHQQVKEGDLPSVLSLLLSFFSNINVMVRDFTTDPITVYEVVTRKTDQRYIPTLVFEEIDSQNSLYVRLKATVPGVPMGLTDLGLTAIVTRPDNGERFEAHPVKPVDMEGPRELLEESVRKCAPSKKEARDLGYDGSLYILPEEMAGKFLFQELPGLLSDFRVIGVDKLKSYKIKAVYPKLNVRLSSGIDFLQGSATVDVGEETFTLADLIKKYTGQRYLQLADGTRAIIDSDYMRRLERIYKHNRGKKGEFKISFFDLPEIEALLDAKVEGDGVKAPREFYSGFARLHAEELAVPGLQATLRPYQKDGVKWIKYLYDNKIGGCLADDMGLGKTIQTISALLTIYGGRKRKIQPALIVMPKSLLFNWKSELARFAPKLRVATYYGTGRTLSEAMKAQIILTTYSVVRNDIEELEKEKFHYVILDESQSIKSVGAQATKAVWLLNAEHRLAISGTPIENNLTELYSLFRFLNPTMFGSLDEFNALYTYPIQKQDSEECAEELRRKVFPFILRRLKKNVLTDLPDLTEQVLYAEMDEEQARFYEQRRADYYNQIHNQIKTEGIGKSQFLLFQALSELRRIASIPESLTDGRIASPKVPMLMEKLEDAVANGHKVVVFFNFIAGLDIAAERMRTSGIGFETMTGATNNRQEVVNRFQTNPDCKVLLMTLKTGGVGLNLTAADTVIIFEPWWNKAAELQAINRLHRIGQTAKVMSYSIITSDTIEERILELQQKKSLLVDNIISSDGSAKQLTEEDIDFILK